MPARATGKVLLEAEQLALASLFPATIVRFSGIYGPGRARIVAQVRDGTARLRGGPPQWTNRIHRDDCARALAHVLALPHPEPIYVASDAEPAPHDAVVAWIAEHLGRPRPPVETGAGDGPRIRGQNKRCRSARLRASGFALRYPTFRDGYATLLG